MQDSYNYIHTVIQQKIMNVSHVVQWYEWYVCKISNKNDTLTHIYNV